MVKNTNLANPSVASKLTAVFLAVSLITVVAGVVGIKNLDRSNELANSMYNRDLQATAYSRDADIYLLSAVRDQKNLLLAQTAETRSASLAMGKKDKAAFLEKIEKAKQAVYSEHCKELLTRIRDGYDDWERFDRKVIAAATEAAPGLASQSAARLSAEGKDKIDGIQELFLELSTLKDYNSMKAAEETSATYRTSTRLMTPFVLGGMLLAFGLGLRLLRDQCE